MIDAVAGAGVAEALQSSVRGKVITPDSADYEQARALWNGRLERHPAAIVQAACSGDVVAAVLEARRRALPLAVRGGGHHPSGFAGVDRGIVIDVSRMKGITVNSAARTARVEGGVTAREFIYAIQEKGFLSTVGSHGTVGMAGMTLGGGIGILMGRYGLACDNLLEVEVVTADGIERRASHSENRDLFWALRGGGGNFGVVTGMTFRLHPSEPVLAGFVAHPIDRAGDVLRFYRTYTETCPDELTALAAILTAPNGAPVCAIMACHTGPLEAGERLMAPLRKFGPPVMDIIQPMPYTAVIDYFNETDLPGAHYAYASRALPSLTDGAIDAIARFGAERTSSDSVTVLYNIHGAASRVPADATAFPLRDVPYMVGIYAGWSGGDAAPHLAWRDDYRAALEPHSLGLGYLNLCDQEGGDQVASSYRMNRARLAETKHLWDPENLFRSCHNVAPEPPSTVVTRATGA